MRAINTKAEYTDPGHLVIEAEVIPGNEVDAGVLAAAAKDLIPQDATVKFEGGALKVVVLLASPSVIAALKEAGHDLLTAGKTAIHEAVNAVESAADVVAGDIKAGVEKVEEVVAGRGRKKAKTAGTKKQPDAPAATEPEVDGGKAPDQGS